MNLTATNPDEPLVVFSDISELMPPLLCPFNKGETVLVPKGTPVQNHLMRKELRPSGRSVRVKLYSVENGTIYRASWDDRPSGPHPTLLEVTKPYIQWVGGQGLFRRAEITPLMLLANRAWFTVNEDAVDRWSYEINELRRWVASRKTV